MFLHWALSAVWPATEAGRRQETAVGAAGIEKDFNCRPVEGQRDCAVWTASDKWSIINMQSVVKKID